MNTDLRPRWMRELERLAAFKSQIILYGNIKDTVHYPLGTEQTNWTLGPLREALFEIFRHQVGQYAVIGAYNPIDGMVFADARDTNVMGKAFDDLVALGESQDTQTHKGRVPQPTKPQDAVEQALHHMRLSLSNRQYPCVFMVEHTSQMIVAPVNIPTCERQGMIRLMKTTGESQVVAVGEGDQRRVVQNLLIIICDKLTDLPAWIYLNNPFSSSIEIESPRMYERRHFFDRFLRPHAAAMGMTFDVDDLVDLTDGMTVRDLCGIRSLARRPEQMQKNAKALVDCYKYGVLESDWDNLDWNRLAHAEEELSQRVIGQAPAVAAVADVLRRARLHLSGAQHSSRSKPRGVLFFAGPTGVGKTELAKAIAELIFHADEACVRFDMSEYSQQNADQRLLGAPPGYVGYEAGGQLTNKMKANPFCVLLFDEIEKAHPSILDKFLQILEDGRMTDGHGDTVYFAESIIIFTSNIGIYHVDPTTGRPMINPVDGQPLMHVNPAVDVEYAAVREKILEGVQSYFKHYLGRPELLNRIGQNIIVFDFIRLTVMRQIMERKVLRSIREQVKERWKLEVEFAPAVLDQLMALAGADISAGGRGMGNLAESAVLNPLSRIMFSLLGQGESIDGKKLRITGIVPPRDTDNMCYSLTWEEVTFVVPA